MLICGDLRFLGTPGWSTLNVRFLILHQLMKCFLLFTDHDNFRQQLLYTEQEIYI